MRRQLITALLLLAVFAAPASAEPASFEPVWATVNVCDPATASNAVGVRANLPGDDTDSRMYARITAEWLNPRTRAWRPVDGVPTSPWLPAGSGRQVSAQVGWTFDFAPPRAGNSFEVRGVAELEWRRGGSVVRRETVVTSGGLSGVDEGDPPGTSLASCTLR